MVGCVGGGGTGALVGCVGGGGTGALVGCVGGGGTGALVGCVGGGGTGALVGCVGGAGGGGRPDDSDLELPLEATGGGGFLDTAGDDELPFGLGVFASTGGGVAELPGFFNFTAKMADISKP